ncbi:hypothetical protein GCM10027273_34260 [Nocardioides pakistanensis]
MFGVDVVGRLLVVNVSHLPRQVSVGAAQGASVRGGRAAWQAVMVNVFVTMPEAIAGPRDTVSLSGCAAHH